MVQFRWMEIEQPDGYYVRIGNRPFRLQARDDGGPWEDVPLQTLFDAKMQAMPTSDPVRSLS